MVSVLSALWPVFAILIMGFLARRINFPGEGFWEPAEKLTYYLLFPALLVNKLGAAQIQGLPVSDFAIAVVSLLLLGTLLCFALRPWLSLTQPGFTSFFQGSIRFNTYVALAIVASLYNDQAVAISAIIIAVMIPLINFLCISVFMMGGAQRITMLGFLRALLKNPLILACLIGISLNVSGVGVHQSVSSIADLLGAMALPLGLLAVGAGLSTRSLKEVKASIWSAAAIKLLIFPLVMFFLCSYMELSSLMTGLLLVFAMVPTAPSGYILARQLGGDAPMMAAMITAQTCLSMVTIPLLLGWFL